MYKNFLILFLAFTSWSKSLKSSDIKIKPFKKNLKDQEYLASKSQEQGATYILDSGDVLLLNLE